MKLKVLIIMTIQMFGTTLATQYQKNLTTIPQDDNLTETSCKVFSMENKIKGLETISFATIAGVCILAGFLVTFAGYRYLRISLFIKGVAVGSFVTFIVCGYYTGLPFSGHLSVSLFVGVVFAVIAVLITVFGLFLSGFTMGFFTGLALLMAISPLFDVTTRWIPFGILLGFSLVFALLSLKFQKNLTIASTAMFGGVLVSISIDFFIEKFLLLRYAWKRILAKDEGDSCWFSWIILAIWPLLFVIGFIIQFKFTARYVDHKGKEKKREHFYGSEKAIKRYRNMNKSGDVVTTSWLRDKKTEEGEDQLMEDVTNV